MAGVADTILERCSPEVFVPDGPLHRNCEICRIIFEAQSWEHVWGNCPALAAAKLGQFGPKRGWYSPTLANIGPTWANIGQHFANCGRLWKLQTCSGENCSSIVSCMSQFLSCGPSGGEKSGGPFSILCRATPAMGCRSIRSGVVVFSDGIGLATTSHVAIRHDPIRPDRRDLN